MCWPRACGDWLLAVRGALQPGQAATTPQRLRRGCCLHGGSVCIRGNLWKTARQFQGPCQTFGVASTISGAVPLGQASNMIGVNCRGIDVGLHVTMSQSLSVYCKPTQPSEPRESNCCFQPKKSKQKGKTGLACANPGYVLCHPVVQHIPQFRCTSFGTIKWCRLCDWSQPLTLTKSGQQAGPHEPCRPWPGSRKCLGSHLGA
jgi:hypothetical protein